MGIPLWLGPLWSFWLSDLSMLSPHQLQFRFPIQHWSSWSFLLMGFASRKLWFSASACLFLWFLVHWFALWPQFSDISSKNCWFFSLFGFSLVNSLHARPKTWSQSVYFKESLLRFIKKLTFYEDSRILLPFYFTFYSLFQLKFTF